MDENPYIKFRNIYVIPTFHSRIEFAKLIHSALFKVFPDVIPNISRVIDSIFIPFKYIKNYNENPFIN